MKENSIDNIIEALVRQEVERITPLLKAELLKDFKESSQDRYLSRKESSEYLNVSISSIDNYVKQGLIKHKLNKATRFKKSELDAFVRGKDP